MKFQNKKILVTGGSSGIGGATARAFARGGADVVITYAKNQTGAEATRKHISSHGRTCELIQADFSTVTENSMAEIIKTAKNHLNGIDILINNAGTVCRKSFLDIDEADYDDLCNLNMKAPWFLTKAFANAVVEAGNNQAACIVNISSISDRLAIDSLALYQMTKAALTMQTQSAALSFAPHGIRVNAVCPGVVATNLNEAQRTNNPDEWLARCNKIPRGPGAPEDIAKMVLFLASNEDAGWITGKSYHVDGGQVGVIFDRG